MNLENLGPFLTFSQVVITLLPLILAVSFWLDGHTFWLILNKKPIPAWLIWLSEVKAKEPFSELCKDIEPYLIHKYKGIAWGINILYAILDMFVLTPKEYPYDRLFGSTPLLSIGGVTFEVAMFLLLTNLLRWLISWQGNKAGR